MRWPPNTRWVSAPPPTSSAPTRTSRAMRPSGRPAPRSWSTAATPHRKGGSPVQPDLSWLGVLEHHARRTPDKPIAVFGEKAVTYQGMAEWSAAVAGGLHERGVGAGDVVALLSYNNVEFLTTIFAANHLGAIAMPINWRLAAPELRFILEHSGARALVCDEALVELANAATNDLDA